MPMAAIPRVRSRSPVMSATYATMDAVTAPEKNPPSSREAYISQSRSSASPNSTKLTQKPSTPVRITGRRPTRSDRLPQKGENRKDMRE